MINKSSFALWISAIRSVLAPAAWAVVEMACVFLLAAVRRRLLLATYPTPETAGVRSTLGGYRS